MRAEEVGVTCGWIFDRQHFMEFVSVFCGSHVGCVGSINKEKKLCDDDSSLNSSAYSVTRKTWGFLVVQVVLLMMSGDP